MRKSTQTEHNNSTKDIDVLLEIQISLQNIEHYLCIITIFLLFTYITGR